MKIGRFDCLVPWYPDIGRTPRKPHSSNKHELSYACWLQYSVYPHPSRSYVVPDADPVDHRGIQELERDLIFSDQNKDRDLSLMHNDFTTSNCIVNNDKLVGLVDWEMAGFLGWKTAGEVHRAIRTPKRENFADLSLSEERLSDILFWNDLYEDK